MIPSAGLLDPFLPWKGVNNRWGGIMLPSSKTNKINHAARGHARYDSVSLTLPFLHLLLPSILPSIRGRRKVASRLLPREIRERCTTTTRTTLFPRTELLLLYRHLPLYLALPSSFFSARVFAQRSHNTIFVFPLFAFLLTVAEPIGLERR